MHATAAFRPRQTAMDLLCTPVRVEVPKARFRGAVATRPETVVHRNHKAYRRNNRIQPDEPPYESLF